MKPLLFSVILMATALNVVWGQNNQQAAPFFDPTLDPVALEVDSGIVLNTVSDFVLIKSLRAQLPFVGKVTAVRRIDQPKYSLLQFQTAQTSPNGSPIFIHIPLVKTAAGGYFVSSVGGVTCSNCGEACNAKDPPPSQQNPCGCCNSIGGGNNTTKITLKKVSLAINSFTE